MIKIIAVSFLLSYCSVLSFAQSHTDFPHYAMIGGENVRLRAQATVKSDLVTELPFGTYLKVLEKSKEPQAFGNGYPFYWVRVETLDGKKGWLYGKYAFFLSKNQKVDCKFRTDKKEFQLYYTAVGPSSYVDFSKLPFEAEGSRKRLLFFVEKSKPHAFYFIRNLEPFSKDHAIDNYFKLEISCCSSDDWCDGCNYGYKDIMLEWVWEVDSDKDKYVYKLEFDEKDGFKLKEKTTIYTLSGYERDE